MVQRESTIHSENIWVFSSHTENSSYLNYLLLRFGGIYISCELKPAKRSTFLVICR